MNAAQPPPKAADSDRAHRNSPLTLTEIPRRCGSAKRGGSPSTLVVSDHAPAVRGRPGAHDHTGGRRGYPRASPAGLDDHRDRPPRRQGPQDGPDYLNGKREPGVRQRAVASVGHHLVRRTSGFGLRGVVSDVDSGDPGPPPATGLRRLRPGHGAGERDHPAPIYSMIFRRINGTARLSRRRTTSRACESAPI